VIEYILIIIDKNNRLQQIFGEKIPNIKYETSESLDVYAHNCENILGVVQIPVGVAGPLSIVGKYAQGEYVVPLATTEACLVASVHRGAKAIAKAGGSVTFVESVGISRAPVFLVEEIKSEEKYTELLDRVFDEMKDSLENISKHTKLLRHEVAVRENYVYVRLWSKTGEAMGMNMVTITAKYLSDRFLENILDGKLIATSSNWCSDKKPSYDNVKIGRKYQVTAKVVLNNEILKSLRVDGKGMMDVYYAKIKGGSELSGSLGHNAHHANIVAAVYAATGQDLAHTVEGSLGSTNLKMVKGGLEISVELPALVCGTVGGGIKLPLQSQFCNVIGLKKKPSTGVQSMELAEVIGAGVLAGEISLLAAIYEKRLASAHKEFRK
jgi:hydroxymethylglutaryl-CoA reductase (NADPH)